jgi:hypothetical protein
MYAEFVRNGVGGVLCECKWTDEGQKRREKRHQWKSERDNDVCYYQDIASGLH